MGTILYEEKLTVEIDELESLLLELSNFENINQFYACIDGRLDGKKKIKNMLIENRKKGGQLVCCKV